MRSILALIIALSLLAAAACGGDDDDGGDGGTGGDDNTNTLVNAGFEDGPTGWTGRGSEVTISEEQAKSGDASALLQMRDDLNSPETMAYAIYQDSTSAEVPDFISLEYFVDHWLRGTTTQYIEVVVILTGSGDDMPVCGQSPCPNIQLRYVLSGVTVEPVPVLNGRFIFVGDVEPTLDEWVHFEANVRDDFFLKYGPLPEVIDSVRVQFEVRYDGKASGGDPLEADVYVDDFYLGE